MGHGAVKQTVFRWIVRIVIIGTILFELAITAASENNTPFAQTIVISMCLANAVLLFLHGRKIYSAILTIVDGITSLRVITLPLKAQPVAIEAGKPNGPQIAESPSSALPAQTNEPGPVEASTEPVASSPTALTKPVITERISMFKALMYHKIFIPTSYPHMVGLFVYIVALGTMLQAVNPISMDFPSIPIPLPVSISQLFSYNGIGLVMLSFCGVGIFVRRDWKAAMKRLGWEKPTWAHVGIGLSLVVFSFCYDLVWAILTHSAPGQDLATKLSGYNSGTFQIGADLSASIFLALATAICAGVGEETLARGAIQPALGIVPAAVLHGVLHAQFSHAPILIIQIAIWSIVFGIVRRFTNTTTTIIGHAGFNFVTTFLFAFNP